MIRPIDGKGRSLTEHSSTTELKKKRTFRKFSYRGIDLDQYVLLDPNLLSHITNISYVPFFSFIDSSTSLPNNCVMSSTPVPAGGSTAASSASPWA
jgi:hypothetical protein